MASRRISTRFRVLLWHACGLAVANTLITIYLPGGWFLMAAIAVVVVTAVGCDRLVSSTAKPQESAESASDPLLMVAKRVGLAVVNFLNGGIAGLILFVCVSALYHPEGGFPIPPFLAWGAGIGAVTGILFPGRVPSVVFHP